MADIRAAQSGDFSSTATWVGGVIPGLGDIAYSNNFTVTISDTRTVQAVGNIAGAGITAGGSFSVVNGCNLTCTNANGLLTTSGSVITTSGLGLGSSASISANVTSAGSSGTIISFTGSGVLNITGNLSAGSASGKIIDFSSTGTLNLTGNMTAGPSVAATLTGGGTYNQTGNVTGGSTGASAFCLRIDGTCTVVINGSVTAGLNGSGINNNAAATLTVNGPCVSSSTQPAIAGGSSTQITRLSGPFLLGASGNVNPVAAFTWRWAPNQIPTYMEVATSSGSGKRNLFTSDNIPTANYPTASNVRSGTVYGPNLENNGTLAVPAPSSVALGVQVDNTIGTAVLTSVNVQTAVQTALGAFSSGRLNNVATVDSTGAQIQAAVSS